MEAEMRISLCGSVFLSMSLVAGHEPRASHLPFVTSEYSFRPTFSPSRDLTLVPQLGHRGGKRLI